MKEFEYPIFLLEGGSCLIVFVESPADLSSHVEENDVHYESYSGGWDRTGRPLQITWRDGRPHVYLKGDQLEKGALIEAIARYALSGSRGSSFHVPEDLDPVVAFQLANDHIRQHTPPTWIERRFRRIFRRRSPEGS